MSNTPKHTTAGGKDALHALVDFLKKHRPGGRTAKQLADGCTLVLLTPTERGGPTVARVIDGHDCFDDAWDIYKKDSNGS